MFITRGNMKPETATKSIYIEHMGSCPARTLDARKFEKYFLSNGFNISTSPKKTDKILFITCAYKKNIEELASKRIRELNNYNSDLIIGGCLKAVNEEELKKSFKGESFATSDNERIDGLFPDFKVKFKDLPDANLLYPESISRKLKRVSSSGINIKLCPGLLKRTWIYIKEKTALFKTYYIRICDGCVDSHCSYCVIWRAVGELRSKPIEVCIEEFRRALSSGHKRIILVGDNVGAYGLDTGHTLPDLLKRIVEIDKDFKIQIDYLNPKWMVKYRKELITVFKSRKIEVVSCMVQSGSTRILKLMNRGYGAQELKEVLRELKRAHSGLRFYAHIIAGFPSETEGEFEDTLNIIKEIGFESVQIFPFCKNIATPAGYIKPEIPDEIIRERLKKAVRFFRKHRIACLVD